MEVRPAARPCWPMGRSSPFRQECRPLRKSEQRFVGTLRSAFILRKEIPLQRKVWGHAALLTTWTNLLLTHRQQFSSLEPSLLHHIPGPLALGFKFPYHVVDFWERCIQDVCKSPLPTRQKKRKSRPWASFQGQALLFLSRWQRP